MTDQDPLEELVDVAYDYYQDFHDDPRRIHYMTLSEELGVENIRVLDYVAEALDLGCRDAQNDIDERPKDGVIDIIGHPSDDRWDLSVEDENGGD